MNESLSKVISGLKYLGIEIKSIQDNFDERFFIQKLTFLFKSLGIKIEFGYTFYLNGPYSPNLSSQYYTYYYEVENLKTDYIPLDEEKKIFSKIKTEVLDKKIKGNRKLEFLEALTTILYFQELKNGALSNETIKLVKEKKPHISEYIILLALNTSKALNFKEEFLTVELKEEISIWDKAED